MLVNRIALSLSASLLLAGCGGGTPKSEPTSTAPEVQAPPIALGTTGTAPGVAVTITSVGQKPHIGDFGPKAASGETFVVVRYTIKNTGAEPLSGFDMPDVELVNGTGQTFAEDREAAVLASLETDDGQSSGDLNPNVTSNETGAWKIDKASFDKKTWRVKVTVGGLGAKLGKAAEWPLKSDAAAPLMFSLE